MKAILLVIVSLYVLQSQGQELEPRIIGSTVSPGVEQNTVAFIDINNDIICSGAVIHALWIVTSATCTKKMSTVPVKFQFTDELINGNTYLQALHIQYAITHPSFKEATLTNDVGLVQPLAPIDTIPLLIPLTDTNFVGQSLLLRGKNLQGTAVVERKVTISDNKFCQQFVPMISTKMCSSFAAACSGDQGAPLMNLNKRELIGIVSMSNDYLSFCGEPFPAPIVIYTKLFGFKAWIRKTTGIMYL